MGGSYPELPWVDTTHTWYGATPCPHPRSHPRGRPWPVPHVTGLLRCSPVPVQSPPQGPRCPAGTLLPRVGSPTHPASGTCPQCQWRSSPPCSGPCSFGRRFPEGSMGAPGRARAGESRGVGKLGHAGGSTSRNTHNTKQPRRTPRGRDWLPPRQSPHDGAAAAGRCTWASVGRVGGRGVLGGGW